MSELYPNQSTAYHLHLDDRRFEELVSDLYFQDIQEGYWGNKFDNVALLGGVGEQGRDCILLKDGKNVGVIQCKLYKNKLSKPETIREIIKFCLYSVLSHDFIYDKNNFEYHFISSCGFNDKTVELLNDFSGRITDESDLDDWINQVISQNATLNQLVFDDIKEYLYDILSSITVIPVSGIDIDRRLSYDHNKNLYQRYFEVKMVVDNSALIPIKEKLEEIEKNVLPRDVDLLYEFRCASFQLYNCKNYFGDLVDSHIERRETTEILNWIKSPLQASADEKDKNILFLSGGAGCGKTTVLRSLYKSLSNDHIPVLGLKADAIAATTLEELRLKTNISHPIAKSLIEVSGKHERIVLLIDQIDALSQYLSSNREYINTYIHLIESLKGFSNIRIIISVREYDLNYDFSLQSFRNHKRIQLGELLDEEVENILSKLGLSKRYLSQTLFVLLKTPNNLDVFCRIYNPETNIHDIKTLQDLYVELWKRLFSEKNIDNHNLRYLLFRIVEKQNEKQAITISLDDIDESSLYEYEYLKSQGVIIEEKDKSGTIQYFV